MLKKNLSLIILILLLSFSLTGCYDAQGLETLSYAIAMGIDEGENNLIKITFQLSINKSGAGSSSEESQSTTITSVECSSIDDGITLLNSHISKKLNLAHCKIIVFSEPLAQKGIKPYINTLSNHVQIRPDCNIIVSRCKAEDFLKNSNPTLETLTARYYEVLLSSKKYTGLTPNVNLGEFVSNLKSVSQEAIAILGGLNAKESTKVNTNSSIYSVDYLYKADEVPLEDKTSMEVLGTAVFKGFKLVGELNALDTICYNIINNDLDYATLSIPSPYSNSGIDVYLSQEKNTKNSVELINGSPYITSKIYLDVKIISSENNIDYLNKSNLEEIQAYANKYLKNQIKNYLYKTAKDFKSDINGFGQHLKTSYLTIEDLENVKWLDIYKNSFFNVEVNTNIDINSLFVKH